MFWWFLFHLAWVDYFLYKVLIRMKAGSTYVSRGAKLKKCIIKGDNWSVKRPTKFLYILNADVVLMTVWGAVCSNLWAIYGLP